MCFALLICLFSKYLVPYLTFLEYSSRHFLLYITVHQDILDELIFKNQSLEARHCGACL